MTDDYVTEDVKRLIGRESPWIEAAHAVEASEVRRFHQATMDDADADDFNRELRPALPPVVVPLTRLLNGGYEYEFFRCARIGEGIFQRSCYKDIYHRNGASGPMVFIVVEDSYRTESGDLLLAATNTLILR